MDHEVFGPDNDGNGIADRIVYHHDFADNDGNASDVNGHGSHVSSIAASVAPGANIIHLKVFSNNSRFASHYDIEQALQWVVANGDTYNVASVNLSLGSGNVGRFVTTRFTNEYAALAAQDIVVSVASGNSGQTGVNVLSADPYVFSVGSVNDTSDRINSFSQRHETLTTVFAPGSPITAANAYGGYSTKSGTSMAAPYIAGIVPLAQEWAVQEIGRRLTVPELRKLLRYTGVTIKDWATGLDFKRVDVLTLGEAILALGGGGSPVPRVSFAAGSITQQEGNSGTTAYAFTVTLDNASDEVVTVDYSTNDGTATVANGDYIDNDGTLTFNPGETRKTITVLVNGDTTFEGHEHFTVTLDSANNGRISPITNTSTRTIIDDDVPPPTISITSIFVLHQEGNSGTTPYAFTVTLDRASDEVVTVNYSTNKGSATTANRDYIDNDGTLTFNPGETRKTITVLVNGDTTFEGHEHFTVT
ncbi:MAG: S8 family serine peptidase, partial [Prochloron sp. SP5CPC1]|nr:S8 family serine peptidase [Candidatus Paraprochloron terpiosi SP5CPC1]